VSIREAMVRIIDASFRAIHAPTPSVIGLVVNHGVTVSSSSCGAGDEYGYPRVENSCFNRREDDCAASNPDEPSLLEQVYTEQIDAAATGPAPTRHVD